jgi:hypothetical protein
VDVLLYDPMPGGSGLLDQLVDRWAEVISAAREVVETCPSDCPTSCPDCLQTYRNAYTHKYLNRHVALDRLENWGDKLVFSHQIPPKQSVSNAESTGTRPVNNAEDILKAMLLRAGFPEPVAQKTIDLSRPYGSTTPDFFFEPPNDMSEGICIYLDGMSRHLHGDPDRAERDRQIRTALENRGYDVLTIPAATWMTAQPWSTTFDGSGANCSGGNGLRDWLRMIRGGNSREITTGGTSNVP